MPFASETLEEVEKHPFVEIHTKKESCVILGDKLFKSLVAFD